MVIETLNSNQKIDITNILLGDVWICSGQSNMEMKISSVKDHYKQELNNTCNNSIRQFLVPVRYDFKNPHEDLEEGYWEAVNDQSILNFTATGYFFAAELFRKYNIPIGLINASLGGSPAEAWLSEAGLINFPEYTNVLHRFKDKRYHDNIINKNETSRENWYLNINKNDVGMPKDGISFVNPKYDASDWTYVTIPSYWKEVGIGEFNGVVWFRKEIEITDNVLEVPATLLLGNIVDGDTTYINGYKVGEISNQYEPRKYLIPKGVIKEGKNIIVVRVVSETGSGGFYKGKPYQLQIGDKNVDLCGDWQYKIGMISDPMPAPVFVSWQPAGLFNGMIAPLLSYAIKGILWYQGESNAQNPDNYEELLKALITDWRMKWNIGDLPFLIVQLPNYMEPIDSPAASHWATIREAQRRTLSIPNTGLAITIDIGEWNDVHPVNKKDVGYRLALAAQKQVYGEKELVISGPMVQSVSLHGNRIVISFRDIGSGLTTREGEELGHFAIAGEDKRFIWAKTSIDKDCIAVWNDQITQPVYVRYGWADNPEGANLYNKEGLPASPFEVSLIENIK